MDEPGLGWSAPPKTTNDGLGFQVRYYPIAHTEIQSRGCASRVCTKLRTASRHLAVSTSSAVGIYRQNLLYRPSDLRQMGRHRAQLIPQMKQRRWSSLSPCRFGRLCSSCLVSAALHSLIGRPPAALTLVGGAIEPTALLSGRRSCAELH